MNPDEILTRWEEEPDEYLLKALKNDLSEYPDEVAMIKFRMLDIEKDLPIKDFEGF